MSKMLTAQDLAPFIMAQCKYGKQQALIGGIFEDDCVLLYHLDGKEQIVETANIKPILRSLDSMTKAEQTEWECLITDARPPEIGVTIMREARRTKWMIEKGFDVNGWIEQGLAIKKEEE